MLRFAPAEDPQHLEALAAHDRQLEVWAENCPENFENRAALVGAEIARIEGASSKPSTFTNKPSAQRAQTALSITRRWPTNWPRASTLARGFEKIARAYLRNARYGYLRWGAGVRFGNSNSYIRTSGRRVVPGRRARSGHRSNNWISRP